MELQPGTLFNDRYRLIREISRGSFGEVWLAQDERLDLEVAVKVYIALDSRGIEEFKTEYKVAYTLNHPNLLHAHHFDVCGNRPFLVMPFCPSSAVALIGQTDEQTAWRFIRDVAAGLDFLHGQNIVHRDIKPDNILCDAEGHFLITDFGISVKMKSTLRRNSTRKMDTNAAGTIGYMAPELFSSNPDAVMATDIWALGASLYEMTTGELPFMGQGGVMQLHGAEVPELKGDFSQSLKETLAACLAKDPWDRPTADRLHEFAKTVLDGGCPSAPWIESAAKKRESKSTVKTSLRTVKQNAPKPLPADPNATVPHSGGMNDGPVIRNRNWFVNVCIWLSIVASVLYTAIYCILTINNYEYTGASRAAAVCSALSAIAGWMVWKYNRLGLWLYLAAQCVIYVVMPLKITGMTILRPGTIIGAVFVIGIFMIRRNGISAWKLMDYRIGGISTYIVAAIGAVAMIVSMVIPNGAVIGARKSIEKYLLNVGECKEIIAQEQPSAESLIDAKRILERIESDDLRYRDIDSRYSESPALKSALKDKTEAVAEQWATAAKSQTRIGNTDKAAEFLSTALLLDEKYRPDFEKAAEKVGFMKPLSIELKTDGGEWGEILYADKIRYLYPRLTYKSLDSKEDHDVKLIVKIYNNGQLKYNASEYSSSYSYSKDITVHPAGGRCELTGWGSDKGGVYSAGPLLVEVWCNGNKLISKSATIYNSDLRPNYIGD